MNKRISTILTLAVVIILAAVWRIPALAARPVMVTICHAAGLAGEPANWVELALPYDSVYGPAGHFSEPGSPNAGHEADYEGPCEVAPTATPAPTDEPTAVPTDIPTDEPTNEPTQEPTGEPTEEPTDEPTIEPTPSEVVPTPTGAVVSTPPPCDEDPCAFLFHLVGPDGQEADYASFDRRPDGGWYLPNVGAQLRCLGWVAVSAPYGRELSRDEADQLTSCFGGFCVVES